MFGSLSQYREVLFNIDEYIMLCLYIFSAPLCGFRERRKTAFAAVDYFIIRYRLQYEYYFVWIQNRKLLIL